MRAYGYNRPLGMGCYPKGYAFEELVNFEHGKQWVEEVGKSCFGYVEFTEDVPEDVLRAYELVTPKMYEDSEPKYPPEAVMRKMMRLFLAEDYDALEKMYDIAEGNGYDVEAIDTLLAKRIAERS